MSTCMRAWTVTKKPMYTSLSPQNGEKHGTYKHGHKFLFLFALCMYQNSDQTIQFGFFYAQSTGAVILVPHSV